MTNNPTIDGVSRELLERIMSYQWFPSGGVSVFDLRRIDRESLRALLDAPSCQTCSDSGAVGNILDVQPCPDCAALAPAVERQGAFAATDRIEDSEEELAMNASPWSPSAERSGAFVKGWMAKAKLAQSTIAQLQALLREADDFMYIMTGDNTQKHLDAKYGKLAWEDAIVDLRGRIATAALNGVKS